MLADGTGRMAFFGTNNVKDALQRAFDDSRYAYTLGFYPDQGIWNGAFRKIKVQVRTDGAHLRYRNGYFAEPEKIESESQATAAIQETAISPLDATSLGITVSGKLAGAAAGRKIELQIGIDPKQLLLQDAENHRKGAVDLYFVQRDAKGETVAAENQRIGLNLEEKQYEFLSKAGLILARHMIIAPEAAEVRVLMHDPASDALGSVTIQARPSGRIAE